MMVPNLQPVALAVNYSPQAGELSRSGRADFDFFKCPNWPDVLRAAERERPAYVHFDTMAGQGQPREREIKDIRALVEVARRSAFRQEM